jgi:hypothetical protein
VVEPVKKEDMDLLRKLSGEAKKRRYAVEEFKFKQKSKWKKTSTMKLCWA